MAAISNEVDVLVGGRLRTRRLLMALSQTAVAERLGVKPQQLHKYERGTNRIPASTLYKLTHILKVDVAYFFQRASTSNQPQAAIAREAETDCEALQAAFLRIPDPATRLKIVSMVEWISDVEERARRE